MNSLSYSQRKTLLQACQTILDGNRLLVSDPDIFALVQEEQAELRFVIDKLIKKIPNQGDGSNKNLFNTDF
jgi:hypothetical protein